MFQNYYGILVTIKAALKPRLHSYINGLCINLYIYIIILYIILII